MNTVISVMCGKGWYSPTGTFKCLPCDYGTYTDSEGQTQCVECPSNKSTRSQASQSAEECIGNTCT